MRVVVWKGHGILDVYAVDSVDQINLLRQDIEACAPHYSNAQLELLRKQTSVQGLINWVNRFTEGDDAFEYFQVSSVKYAGFA